MLSMLLWKHLLSAPHACPLHSILLSISLSLSHTVHNHSFKTAHSHTHTPSPATPWPYLSVVCLILFNGTQILFLNRLLALFDLIVVVPAFQVLFLIVSVICGGVAFGEFAEFTILQAVMFPLAILMSAAGVVIISTGVGDGDGDPGTTLTENGDHEDMDSDVSDADVAVSAMGNSEAANAPGLSPISEDALRPRVALAVKLRSHSAGPSTAKAARRRREMMPSTSMTSVASGGAMLSTTFSLAALTTVVLSRGKGVGKRGAGLAGSPMLVGDTQRKLLRREQIRRRFRLAALKQLQASNKEEAGLRGNEDSEEEGQLGDAGGQDGGAVQRPPTFGPTVLVRPKTAKINLLALPRLPVQAAPPAVLPGLEEEAMKRGRIAAAGATATKTATAASAAAASKYTVHVVENA